MKYEWILRDIKDRMDKDKSFYHYGTACDYDISWNIYVKYVWGNVEFDFDFDRYYVEYFLYIELGKLTKQERRILWEEANNDKKIKVHHSQISFQLDFGDRSDEEKRILDFLLNELRRMASADCRPLLEKEELEAYRCRQLQSSFDMLYELINDEVDEENPNIFNDIQSKVDELYKMVMEDDSALNDETV
jgi:hypothetical protein